MEKGRERRGRWKDGDWEKEWGGNGREGKGQ